VSIQVSFKCCSSIRIIERGWLFNLTREQRKCPYCESELSEWISVCNSQTTRNPNTTQTQPIYRIGYKLTKGLISVAFGAYTRIVLHATHRFQHTLFWEGTTSLNNVNVNLSWFRSLFFNELLSLNIIFDQTKAVDAYLHQL